MSSMSSGNSLPQLSTVAWLSVLLSGLATLILGIYPVIVYPIVARRAASSALTSVLRSPVLALGFAALTVGFLVLALTGTRPARARNRAAHAALLAAVLGVAALVVGIYASA